MSQRRQQARLTGLYVHLPFCDVKCAYCDFYSVAARHVDASFWPRYVAKLKADIDWQYQRITEDSRGVVLASIFFGGGTPSKAPAFVFNEIIAHACSVFARAMPELEISAEANPESLTEHVANDWAAAKINRVSIGMQSRDPAVLKYLGRLYNSAAYENVIKIVQAAGIKNINTDFITGVPGQTIRSTLADIDFALASGVKHLSLYQLTIEPGTLLKSRIETGRLKPPADGRQLRQMRIAANHLQRAGLMRYEISNFALPHFRCLHNQIYWTHRPYLGVGVAAHAFTGRRRFLNVRSLDRFTAPNNLPEEDTQVQPRDALINRLRLLQPMAVPRLLDFFEEGQHGKVLAVLKAAESRGWIDITTNTFRLSESGLSFTDSLIAELWNL
jgi:oxygen-independent coproporphyrinogen-3 oxidase